MTVFAAIFPFTPAVLTENKGDYAKVPTAPTASLPYPDGLLFPSHVWQSATDPQVVIEPAWRVSLVHGMPSSILGMLPTAYYLAACFQEDYEQAVLPAVDGGGANMSRAMLTGALVGAQMGLPGIPTAS